MYFSVSNNYKFDKSKMDFNYAILSDLKKLNDLYSNEIYKGNKVAYYYEAMDGSILSYNPDICFYAASSIKILVCLKLFMDASDNKINLHDKILVKKEELKPGSGIIRKNKKDVSYEILDLIRLTLVESDNTAYLKLVGLIGKDKLKDFGNSMGAIHTMEGKETDSFGIINCSDMIIYWKKVMEFINNNKQYGKTFRSYLIDPSFKIIDLNNLDNNIFIRKYGEWDIAYHETGYVDGKKPYYLIVLTQLNKKRYRKSFINKTAKMINDINNKLV